MLHNTGQGTATVNNHGTVTNNNNYYTGNPTSVNPPTHTNPNNSASTSSIVVGVFIALSKEWNIAGTFLQEKHVTLEGMNFKKGYYKSFVVGNVKYVFIVGGQGATESVNILKRALEEIEIDYLVNIGISAGADDAKLRDVVVGTHAVIFDYN